jgi:hypothetical protein
MESWPNTASRNAALAAATLPAAPNRSVAPWPQGVNPGVTYASPTPWSTASSISAALAAARTTTGR